jgi:hypothetical protein
MSHIFDVGELATVTSSTDHGPNHPWTPAGWTGEILRGNHRSDEHDEFHRETVCLVEFPDDEFSPRVIPAGHLEPAIPAG